MFFLRRIDDNEESYKLLYSFITNNNQNWKQTNAMSFIIQGKMPPKQESLSDYEYFKLLRKKQKQIEFLPSQEYILLKDGQPVTSVYVMMRTKEIADISLSTAEKHQHQGNATQALTLVEQILFNNPDIIFTTIMDMTPTKATSKLAIKMGYIYSSEANAFIKANPNQNLEELIEINKTSKRKP